MLRQQVCQAQSWKAVHKYECKALSQQYPRVPPSLTRMVMQFLLRKQAGALSTTELEDFGGLQDHLDHFRKIGPEDESQFGGLKDISLMSHAALKFSDVQETAEYVASVTARVSDIP